MTLIPKILLGLSIAIAVTSTVILTYTPPAPLVAPHEAQQINQFNREVVQEDEVGMPAIKRITSKEISDCHPSYEGACLKTGVGDYDCAKGSGNGPNYTGVIRVVGPDTFDLDRDNDGWGCE